MINQYLFRSIFFACPKKTNQKKGQPYTWPTTSLCCSQKADASESRFAPPSRSYTFCCAARLREMAPKNNSSNEDRWFAHYHIADFNKYIIEEVNGLIRLFFLDFMFFLFLEPNPVQLSIADVAEKGRWHV